MHSGARRKVQLESVDMLHEKLFTLVALTPYISQDRRSLAHLQADDYAWLQMEPRSAVIVAFSNIACYAIPLLCLLGWLLVER